MSAYSVVIPTTEDSDGDQIERFRFVAEASMRWICASVLIEADPAMPHDRAFAIAEAKISVTSKGESLYVNGVFFMQCTPSYE